MKDWLKVSLILVLFGFFREMRPSEPFVTEFLSGEWRNITSDQVNREVYPIGTYSYLGFLVVAFLITDLLRYKPIIVFSACVGIVLWSGLLWTSSMGALQFVQVCYGMFMASEVAYYTYMYAKVEKSKYQQVTGHARAGILSGRFIAGVLAQILISFKLMNVRELNYISFGSQCVSLFVAIFLPSVGTSLYFNSQANNKKIDSNINKESEIDPNVSSIKSNIDSTNTQSIDENNPTESRQDLTETPTKKLSYSAAFHLLWEHFIAAYSNKTVVLWSLWWALAMCGFLQVQTYIQFLWQEIDTEQENFFNGGVEAILTLFGALAAIAAGFLNSKKFEKWYMWILTACSILEGAFILWAAFTNNVFIAYAMYIAFGILYQFMITVASATVAKRLNEDSFALIFGINTLFALIFQTILTMVVVSETGLGLDTRDQFIVYGGYFVGLGCIYGVAGVVSQIYKIKSVKNLD